MKIIAIYLICGMAIGLHAVVMETKGGFNPRTADEEDEIAIGRIVLMWPAYLITKFKN